MTIRQAWRRKDKPMAQPRAALMRAAAQPVKPAATGGRAAESTARPVAAGGEATAVKGTAGAGMAGAGRAWQRSRAGWEARRRITHRGKTLRALRAYLDLLDTTAYMQKEMQSQLEAFDITIRTIRILEMLYRKGGMGIRAMASELKCSRQNIKSILRPLRERDWVALDMRTLPPVEQGETRASTGKRDKRLGRAVGMVRLTARGKKFVGVFLPKHAKVVKSLMRVLDGREQVTLSRLLRKLREGDITKFVREIRMYDDENWDRVAMDRSGYI